MWLAAIILVAHTVITHQHSSVRDYSKDSSFSFYKGNSSESTVDFLDAIKSLIQESNPGEKHLENYTISSYDSDFSVPFYVVLPEIFFFQVEDDIHFVEVAKPNHFYPVGFVKSFFYTDSGLRAPPFI